MLRRARAGRRRVSRPGSAKRSLAAISRHEVNPAPSRASYHQRAASRPGCHQMVPWNLTGALGADDHIMLPATMLGQFPLKAVPFICIAGASMGGFQTMVLRSIEMPSSEPQSQVAV